jgi:predicted permease
MLNKLRSFSRAAWKRAAFERDMDEEMRFHLEARAADLVRGGLAPEEAARRARRDFGNPAAWEDSCREARRLHLLDDLQADVRFALRSFRRHPMLSATVVLTLTLGIGVSSGVFTLFSAVALRPVVDSDPASFVRLYTTFTGDRTRVGPFAQASAEEYFAFRDRLRTVRALAAFGQFGAWMGAGDGASTRMLLVSCNFFDVYGPERAALGRLLQERDCDAGDPVMVLSDGAWRTRFGADPAVIGRVVPIKDVAVTIVGVAPRSAAALENSGAWLPYTLRPRLTRGPDPRRMVDGHYPHDRWLNLGGRLAAGATREQAGAEASVVAAQQDRLHPGQTSAALVTGGALVHEPGVRANVLSIVTLVMGALSGLVLIACANVATLLLSRADARQQEIAVRLSLGAGRSRLMRMLLTETLILAACAGVASLYVAREMPVILVRWLLNGTPEYSLAPDWRVFVYLSSTVCLAGIVAGLAPALESMRVDVLDSLKGRRSVLSAAIGGSRLRAALVATQVALSFVLLVGAALFVVTHYRIVTRDVGLETYHVLMPRVSYRASTAARQPPTPAELQQTLERVPGVQHVVFAATAPGFGPSKLEIARPDAAPLSIDANEVSSGFFQAVDIPIVLGRALDERDRPCAGGECEVVVSEALVWQLLPRGDPIGRTLHSTSGAALRVVGVARDTSMQEIGRADAPLIYLPWVADGRPYQALVRFTGDGGRFARDVADTLRARFPGAIVDTHTLRWTVELWLDEIGKIEGLVVALGVTAAGLAVLGVFGVVSFAVSRREHELGVRLALGASACDIFATVIGVGIRPVGAGLLCGTALALMTAIGFARVLQKLKFAVSPSDPVTYACAALVLVAVIVLALLVPARRAASVSPLTALKAE